MTIYRGVSGVNREIKQQFRGVSGVNREIKEQYRGVDEVNRLIFSTLKVYIYKEGDECTSLTGGIKNTQTVDPGSGVFTKNANNITLSAGGNSSNVGLLTVNSINLTPYTKVVFDCEWSKNNSKTHNPKEGLIVDINNDGNNGLYDGGLLALNNTLDSSFSRTLKEINITNINKAGWIGVREGTGAGTSGINIFKVYNIWLE